MGRGWIAVVCAVVACGDGAGSGKFASGLDGERALVDLTAKEAAKLCMGVQGWANQAIPLTKREMLVCKSGALVAVALDGKPGRLQMICEETYDRCLEHSAMAPAAVACPSPGPDCTATVADYEECVNDFPASFDRAVTALPSCDMLTLDAIYRSSIAAALFLPPSCMAFQRKCPGTQVTGFPVGGL
jgi:hypothetical protein